MEVYPIRVPIKSETLSFGRVDEMHYAIVRVRDEDGEEGFGEAAILQGPYWSEESIESVYFTIERYIKPLLLHRNIDPHLLSGRLSNIRGNAFAKAAVEMSLFDLLGKKLRKNIADLLGGAVRDRLRLSWTLASNSTNKDVADAEKKLEDGFGIFKLKVGSMPLERDIDRTKKIFNALDGRASLRVDANQGWDIKSATNFMSAVDRFGLTFVEQPLQYWDVNGLARLSKRFSTPILADESLKTKEDAKLLCRTGAVSGFSYKLEKSGGFTESLAIEKIASRERIHGYMGCMIETSVGTAAYAAFAAVVRDLKYGTELFGPLRISYDISTEPMTFEDGQLSRPRGPGLGVEVDMEKLETLSRLI